MKFNLLNSFLCYSIRLLMEIAMVRRVGAPGALAEQRGPGIRRGRLPGGSKEGKAASQSALGAPGLTVGHSSLQEESPGPNPGGAAQIQTSGPSCWKQRRSGSKPRD